MATLRLKVEGEPGAISLRSFATAMNSSLRMLTELDAAISGERSGALDWVVSKLSEGSLVVEVESRSRIEGRDHGPEVTHAFVGGLHQIEHDGTTPPYLTERGLAHARRLVRLVGSDGTRGLRVSDDRETIEITPRAATNVERLLEIRHRAVGSVEGKLDVISVHGGTPRFIVYLSRTHKAVTCRFGEDQLEQAKAALGRRVHAAGIVHSNAMGEPVRVDIERIRKLRGPKELPAIGDLAGKDPGFTGGLSSTDYLRAMRGA